MRTTPSDIQIYCDYMVEVRTRIAIVQAILEGRADLSYTVAVLRAAKATSGNKVFPSSVWRMASSVATTTS